MKTILLMLSIVTLFGCATGGVSLIDPEKLNAPNKNISLDLSNEVSTVQLYGAVKAKQVEGLLPGKYTAVKEDVDGIYFQGDKKSVFLQHESMDVPSYYEGGVWIPKDTNKNVRMFVFYSTKTERPKKSFGLIIDSLVAKDMGKMNVHPEITDKSFNETIKALYRESK